MKTLLVLFLFLLSLLSCQDTNCSGKDVSEDMEEPVDTTQGYGYLLGRQG